MKERNRPDAWLGSPLGWAARLGRGNGEDTNGITPCLWQNFTCKFEPGTGACIGNMQNSACVRSDKVTDGAGKIAGECRSAELISHTSAVIRVPFFPDIKMRCRTVANAKQAQGVEMLFKAWRARSANGDFGSKSMILWNCVRACTVSFNF